MQLIEDPSSIRRELYVQMVQNKRLSPILDATYI